MSPIRIQRYLAQVFAVGILITVLQPARTATATTPQAPGPAFGVATHLMWHDLRQAKMDLDRIQAAGLSTVRFDVNWEDFEPEQGKWNRTYLRKLDNVLAEMKARGIRPILVIIETPEWARASEGTKMTPPKNPADFGTAMGYLAKRYANHPGLAYEIWNEPNDPNFWNTLAGPDPVFYTRMLRAAYRTIKQADPDATVLGGSILYNDLAYLDRMYSAGAAGHFDALALHPYNEGNAPRWIEHEQEWFSFPLTVTQMKKRMAAHGEPNKTIWITEMGWPTSKVDDATRASYFIQAVHMVRGWHYVKTFVAYTLNQRDYPIYGFVTLDGKPTASWKAYTWVARPFRRIQRRPAFRRRPFPIGEQSTYSWNMPQPAMVGCSVASTQPEGVRGRCLRLNVPHAEDGAMNL
jgi:hypothetical protein